MLFIIIGMFFALFAVNAWAARRSVKSIRACRFPAIKCTEGARTKIAAELENISGSPAGMVDLVSGFGSVLKAGIIPPMGKLKVTPHIVFGRRGVYRMNSFRVFSSFPFGFVKASGKLDADAEFIVYPEVCRCESPRAAGFEPMTGGKFRGKFKSHTGSDFAGVRQYCPGDSVKSIHWKSSAKGRDLMVKEFNEELSGRLAFIIDCSAMTAGNGESMLDREARAAGSMILAALHCDHYVEMIDTSSMQLMRIPSYTDSDPVLEALARLSETKEFPSSEKFIEALGMLNPRAALCLILTGLHQGAVEFLKRVSAEQRTVTVCLPEGTETTSLPEEIRLAFYGKKSLKYL